MTLLGAIIPAAGASARMGHPKALLVYRGTTFLEGVLDAAYAAGIERRVVVLGNHADQIRAAVDLSGVQVVMSEDVTAGPIGSIRAGITAVLNHPVEAALVWPVDRPHVQVATIQALAAAFLGQRHEIVVPEYEGRRGHPVIFARSVFDELLAAPDHVGARAVVRRDPARVVCVAVDDAAVLEDLNTPEDYRDLVRREDRHRAGD